MATNDPPLDEIQWRHPQLAAEMQGIHSNSVLFYFAESPFFDRTSNNATVMTQALYSQGMYQYIQTREAFERRLKEMNGLEFMVAEQPASMAPGTGTGVWVIRKQTRRKRPGEEDDVTVHATYYVVGDNIYMAPTLADLLNYRMTTIASGLRKCFPAADEARTWSPATGHLYKTATTSTNARERGLTSKVATPMPESQANKDAETNGNNKTSSSQSTAPNGRLADWSFHIHNHFGGEYMDENPIVGKPGEFHHSSTGRKELLQQKMQPLSLDTLSASFKSPTSTTTEVGAGGKKDSKGDKTPKTPTGGPSKPKRRKSKAGATPTST